MTVKQIGLFTTSSKEVEDFVNRVSRYNINHLAAPVTLDISPYENGDELIAHPHYKISLTFPSKEILQNFWNQ